jgi:tRNA-Thr(GGU) m(6)t(6)A37 methyltransferase TsaA
VHVSEEPSRSCPEFAGGLQDFDRFSHLYVLWHFHLVTDRELLSRPPSEDRPHGAFFTRSPRRKNPIGLTVVRLFERRGRSLRVRGVDMLDGTPVLDLKPYLSSVPAEELVRGWVAEVEARSAMGEARKWSFEAS